MVDKFVDWLIGRKTDKDKDTVVTDTAGSQLLSKTFDIFVGSCEDPDYLYEGEHGDDMIGEKTIPEVHSWTICGRICQARSTCRIWQWDKYSLKCKIAFASEDNLKTRIPNWYSSFVSGDEQCPGKKKTYVKI